MKTEHKLLWTSTVSNIPHILQCIGLASHTTTQLPSHTHTHTQPHLQGVSDDGVGARVSICGHWLEDHVYWRVLKHIHTVLHKIKTWCLVIEVFHRERDRGVGTHARSTPVTSLEGECVCRCVYVYVLCAYVRCVYTGCA